MASLDLRKSITRMAAAMWLPPLATRIALLIENHVPPGLADVRGFVSDLGASLLATLWLLLVIRWSRLLALLLAAAWAVLCYVNYEHVSALGAPASLDRARFVADPTFLGGSAVSPRNLALLLAVVVATEALVASASRRDLSRRRVAALALAALAAMVVESAWPTAGEALAWRQRNFVPPNLEWLGRAAVARFSAAPARDGGAAAARFYAADRNGRPIVPLGNRGANVLLIVLESVSGAYVEPIASDHGVRTSLRMPALGRLAREQLAFSTFFSMQRQSNRALYVLLCGDYPKLVSGEAKFTELVHGSDALCLPRALRDAGYETVYLQSAPLSFMLFDQALPKTGFSRVLGDGWFTGPAYAKNEWGIDDRSFFQETHRLIEELAGGGKPWFLVLDTAGTHHPYLLPTTPGRPPAEATFGDALEYLDGALGRFVAELRRRGVLEGTLLLITSDESVGVGGSVPARSIATGKTVDDVTKELSQNWGVLVALGPGIPRRRVDAVFTQTDIALSVLDYLGIDSPSARFVGRSLFREYDHPRPIIFANSDQKRLGLLGPEGILSLCSEDFESCFAYRTQRGRPFSPSREPVRPDPNTIGLLRAAAETTSRTLLAATRIRSFDLVKEPELPIAPEGEYQILIGGQNLFVPAGSEIDVDVEARVLGEPGRFILAHALASVDGRHFTRAFDVQPGDHVVFRYRYVPGKPLRHLHVWMEALDLRGGPLRLRFERARMTLSQPIAGESDGRAFLTIQRAAVDHAAGA